MFDSQSHSSFNTFNDQQRNILDSKINLAKAHYDKKKVKITKLVDRMGESDDDESGRFGDHLKKRRRIRNMLHFKWNRDDPNLMLDLPTKVTHTQEMIDCAALQQ